MGLGISNTINNDGLHSLYIQKFTSYHASNKTNKTGPRQLLTALPPWYSKYPTFRILTPFLVEYHNSTKNDCNFLYKTGQGKNSGAAGCKPPKFWNKVPSRRATSEDIPRSETPNKYYPLQEINLKWLREKSSYCYPNRFLLVPINHYFFSPHNAALESEGYHLFIALKLYWFPTLIDLINPCVALSPTLPWSTGCGAGARGWCCLSRQGLLLFGNLNTNLEGFWWQRFSGIIKLGICNG